MSADFKKLAKIKMLEAKRKAKEELKQAKLKEKQKQLEKKQKEESVKAEKKAYTKRIYEEIIKPYYKSEEEYIKADNLYIEKMEDGNICGKNKDEYFYSYQKNDTTHIRVFQYTPDFSTGGYKLDGFRLKEVALNYSGNVISDYVKEGQCWVNEIDSTYTILKDIKDRVDENLKKLDKDSKR